MSITVHIEEYHSDSTNFGSYDYMETTIDCESCEGCVLFCGNGAGDVWYNEAEVTPEQWSQIVELDREMVEVLNGYVSRAAQILESSKKVLPA